jgi:hypothetical protein
MGDSMQSSRPVSGMSRPKSGYSLTSVKSSASLKSTQSEFGQPREQKPLEFLETADDYGKVVFRNIPQNVYELEVIESHNYLPEKKVTLF